MKHTYLFFVTLLASLVFESAPAEASQNIVLVAMSGYATCGLNNRYMHHPGLRPPATAQPGMGPYGMDLYPYWGELRRQITSNRDVTVEMALSCYSGNGGHRLSWVTSRDAGNVTHEAWDHPEAFFESIKALSHDFRDPIVLVGYSYGGWLASHFTAYMGRHNARRATLFTIDPISPYHCFHRQVLAYFAGCAAGRVEQLAGPRAPHPISDRLNEISTGCQTFPPQFTNGAGRSFPLMGGRATGTFMLDNIRRGAASWLNFFQRDDTVVTSDEVPEAAQIPANQSFRYTRRTRYLNMAHRHIHDELELWNRIATTASDTLGRLGVAAAPSPRALLSERWEQIAALNERTQAPVQCPNL